MNFLDHVGISLLANIAGKIQRLPIRTRHVCGVESFGRWQFKNNRGGYSVGFLFNSTNISSK